MFFNDNEANHDLPFAEVVPLSSRIQPDQAVTILGQLEQCWRGLCRPDGTPYRSDITASALGPALPYAFLAERVAASTLRLRVAGRELDLIAGMEVRGLPLSALFSVPARKTLTEATQTMTERPALVELLLSLPSGLLRRAQRGRMMLLPLRDDAGGLTRVMGAIVLDEKVHGRAPVRLDIPEDQPVRVEPVPIRAVAPVKRPGNGRPALRLVVSND
ncbi:MAG: PAS domain-containing protein [Flavimaricola sp.]|nr:PAS domain-containing protein [Flavimaricola sp.]